MPELLSHVEFAKLLSAQPTLRRQMRALLAIARDHYQALGAADQGA